MAPCTNSADVTFKNNVLAFTGNAKRQNTIVPHQIKTVPTKTEKNRVNKILLVDDDPLIKIVIEAMLEKENFHVDYAASAVEAMIMVSQTQYDIILMDIVMPEFTGTAAMLKIKKHIGSATKIIAHTANKYNNNEHDYISIGFDNYLLKPVKQAVLLDTLKSLSE